MSLSFVQRSVARSASPVAPLRKCASVRQPAKEAYHCTDCEKARSMLPAELAKRMEMAKTLLLLDCRSFISYNLNHVRGALNVSCCDRLTKRRLQGGKASVADLVSGNDAKTLFRELIQSEIVLYDEKSKDVSSLTPQSSLHLVLTALLKEGKEVSVLKGEFYVWLTTFYIIKSSLLYMFTQLFWAVETTSPYMNNILVYDLITSYRPLDLA